LNVGLGWVLGLALVVVGDRAIFSTIGMRALASLPTRAIGRSRVKSI
jgi:hypothetical protein